MYIFWFLHQTTTYFLSFFIYTGCISFDSYIKPQPYLRTSARHAGCISFDSYIKPQLWTLIIKHLRVVYLLIPTSNHNRDFFYIFFCQLYIFWFLHQTTTQGSSRARRRKLYIFWFLHQTTTLSQQTAVRLSCISFDSYIKPQHRHAHYRI